MVKTKPKSEAAEPVEQTIAPWLSIDRLSVNERAGERTNFVSATITVGGANNDGCRTAIIAQNTARAEFTRQLDEAVKEFTAIQPLHADLQALRSQAAAIRERIEGLQVSLDECVAAADEPSCADVIAIGAKQQTLESELTRMQLLFTRKAAQIADVEAKLDPLVKQHRRDAGEALAAEAREVKKTILNELARFLEPRLSRLMAADAVMERARQSFDATFETWKLK